MTALNIPADKYPQNRLNELARHLRAMAEELDDIGKKIFDPTLPPDDFAMESTNAQVGIISNALTAMSGDVTGWWDNTAHQFMEANP